MFSGFMTNAWEVGTIVAIVAGVVGFFVVLRGAAFPAHAIPNGAFAGAAGANLIGVNPLLGLGVFSLVAALGIGSLGRRGKPDVATALALVMMLALGAAFLSQSTEYEPEIFSLLFGEILGVSASEILPIALLGLACIGLVGLLYRRLMLTSLIPEVAAAKGLQPHKIEMAFLVVVALATTMTVPVVGALLIFTLMIGPPAAARCFTDRTGSLLDSGRWRLRSSRCGARLHARSNPTGRWGSSWPCSARRGLASGDPLLRCVGAAAAGFASEAHTRIRHPGLSAATRRRRTSARRAHWQVRSGADARCDLPRRPSRAGLMSSSGPSAVVLTGV